MDEGTAVVLAVQLTALCSIAGSLLLYLAWKAKRPQDPEARLGTGRSVLVTSSENALGLQLSLHLASAGFRVFAGVKEAQSDAARVLRAKLKASGAPPAALVVIPLDVTREDSLHEAVDEIRRHLPAGEHGPSSGRMCSVKCDLFVFISTHAVDALDTCSLWVYIHIYNRFQFTTSNKHFIQNYWGEHYMIT